MTGTTNGDPANKDRPGGIADALTPPDPQPSVDGISTTALALGGIGLVLSFGSGFLGLLPSLAGAYLGLQGRRWAKAEGQSSGMATVGLTLGIMGTVLSVVALALWVVAR